MIAQLCDPPGYFTDLTILTGSPTTPRYSTSAAEYCDISDQAADTFWLKRKKVTVDFHCGRSIAGREAALWPIHGDDGGIRESPWTAE